MGSQLMNPSGGKDMVEAKETRMDSVLPAVMAARMDMAAREMILSIMYRMFQNEIAVN